MLLNDIHFVCKHHHAEPQFQAVVRQPTQGIGYFAHSTPLVQSRSFEIVVKLQLGFVWEKAINTLVECSTQLSVLGFMFVE